MMTMRDEHPAITAESVGLRDFLQILRRRKALFIQVFVLMVTTGLVVTALSKPVYRTHATLMVPIGSPALNVVDTNNPLAPILAAAQPDTVAAQLQSLQSRPFLRVAEERANVVPRPGEMRPSVRVSNDGSNVIEIIVDGGNPEGIARLANAIIDEHLERTDQLARRGIEKATQFVKEERGKAASELAEAEQRLVAFRSENQVMELQADQQARVKEYVDLQNRSRTLQTSLLTTRARLADLRERLETEPLEITFESARPNPERDRVQRRLEELQLEREELLREFAPGSRWVREIEDRIAILERRLDEQPIEVPVPARMINPARAPLLSRITDLEASLQADEAEYEAAQVQLVAARARMQGTAPWEVEIGRLTEERDRARAAHAMLSDRLRDLEIRANAEVQVARAIERAAVPLIPIRPRRTVNLILSGLLALLAATTVVLLREYLDDRIQSPADLERIAPGLTALSWVPHMDAEREPLVLFLPTNSHAAEAYRTLRSGIGFASLDKPLRRLQVTSAAKGEGKTTTAVNLAIAMAMDGKRVILVDADLRRPSLDRLLEVPRTPGFTEVLAGLKTLDEALQPTQVENLQVLCAGPTMPNPAEVLGSRTFEDLLQQLDERADLVIFDSPPCVPVTDPSLIAARMDGVILVVHAGHTRRGAIKQAETLLRRARARIVGVVFNRVDAHQDHYYYYTGYYGGDGYYSDTAERGGRLRRVRGHGKPNGQPKSVAERSTASPTEAKESEE